MKQSKVNGLVPELSEATGEPILVSNSRANISRLSYCNISALILPLLLVAELVKFLPISRGGRLLIDLVFKKSNHHQSPELT